MPDQIYIGNFARGLKKNPLPFNIDNDAFPTLYNAYSWRGRVKRKRGTQLLGRLQKQLSAVLVPTNPWQVGPLVLAAGAGNLVSGFSLGTNASIAPGTINLTVGANAYTEPSPPDGTLLRNGLADPNSSINYATGAIFIQGGGAGSLVGKFGYFPDLPVMGLRDFSSTTNTQLYPTLLAFDTKNAYQVNQTISAVNFYNVTYYKNTNKPFVWSGQDYQQFWTTNYQGALWSTNNKPGFHFGNVTYSAGSGTANITINITSGGVNITNLIVGDVLWFNEFAGGSTINGLNATVSNAAGAAAGNYVVTFASAQTVAGTGIAQLLTSSITGQDGIKWYDGDPTAATGIPTVTGLGWVNFAPPLTATNVSINDTPLGKYYLVGALAIVEFKDRLLFFSPYIQTSTGAAIQLYDTCIWSWNGTPYYSSLVPSNQTSAANAYYVDQTGLGGYKSAGISNAIATVSSNEDVIIVGFSGDGRKTRFVYTGNDFDPFLFFTINNELPSVSTFSAVSLDKGVIDLGQYGFAMTDQQSSSRIDLDIPDEVFRVQALNNGVFRVNAQRDFFREWIYFSYPVNTSQWKFPTETLMFNYRDNTWAIFYENFTAHGRYRAKVKRTWQTLPFKTWAEWREPWNSGASSPEFTSVVAGNPQGYVLIKAQGTGEGRSGAIVSFANSAGNTLITSINHCLRSGDYLLIQGVLGPTSYNNAIGRVITTPTADTFTIDLPYDATAYLGLGEYTRLSQPLIQTKQFPFYWEQGRKTRLSAQRYLMDYTANAQVTVNIYLSQDPDEAFNDPTINVPPNSLVYSQIMYTCPESTNLGLTPANVNLQMPTAQGSYQIWHRFNTSLIGDSVQIGITLNDDQMRNLTYATSEITLQGIHLTVEMGPMLA